MRGYPERTLATRAKWLLDTREDAEVSTTEWVAEMEAILKGLIDAPEPEPVAHAVILLDGMTRIWFSDKERGEQWRKQEGIKQKLTPLYTAPPAPSVPDEQLQAAFDRGLKAGNEQSVAQQIEIHKLHDSLAARPPEQPADLVHDASPHPDDIAVDIFAAAMKAKMEKQRIKGYGGWQDKEKCHTNRLRNLLVDHVTKGDPVDVGNFAMMLFNRGDSTAACKTCGGTGQCDDAYPGDIGYDSWPCPDCAKTVERDKLKGGAA